MTRIFRRNPDHHRSRAVRNPVALKVSDAICRSFLALSEAVLGRRSFERKEHTCMYVWKFSGGSAPLAARPF